MLLETFMTAFLKREFARTLQLSDFNKLVPPRPEPGVEYLAYLHIPFCEELCPYCSFNRVPLEPDLGRRYFRALRKELAMYADLGFNFAAAYVGGGTPTVLPEELALLLGDLKRLFNVREISVETNPNHLNDPIVGMLAGEGVNRLSVGTQSFDDRLLELMERRHKYGSGQEVRERLEKYMGRFDTLNVDMIFNFPTQTMEALDRDLEIIKNIRADQATFYPLMVSDMTRRQLSERFGAISYRQEKSFYKRITEALDEEYSSGTAWCFSRRKGMIDEYIVDYDEYVGLGSGSFGYAGGAVQANTFSIPGYIATVNAGSFPLEGIKEFSPKEQIRYDFMMKLFGTSMDLRKAEEKFHGEFRRTLRKEIALFKSLGAISVNGDTVTLTPRGRYWWVIMMREFFTGVNNFRDICRARIKEAQEPAG